MQIGMVHPLFHLGYDFSLFRCVLGVLSHFVKFWPKFEIRPIQNTTYSSKKKKMHSEARANQIRERERERERVFNVRVLGGEELEN